MITTTQRKKMKKVFKLGYYKPLQKILKDKNATNKKGVEFSKAYISHVFNGRNSNEFIEDAFLELYQKMRDEQSKKRIIRKEIFETKKTEAGTSVRN